MLVVGLSMSIGVGLEELVQGGSAMRADDELVPGQGSIARVFQTARFLDKRDEPHVEHVFLLAVCHGAIVDAAYLFVGDHHVLTLVVLLGELV